MFDIYSVQGRRCVRNFKLISLRCGKVVDVDNGARTCVRCITCT